MTKINQTLFTLIFALFALVQGALAEVAKPTIRCDAACEASNREFTHSTAIKITAEEGATIYYTTNNIEPSTMSPVYTGSFVITKQTNIWAIAEKDGVFSEVSKMTIKKNKHFTVEPNVEPGTYYGTTSVTFTAKNGTTPYGEIKYSVNGTTATTDKGYFTVSLSSSSTVTIVSATDDASGSMQNVSFVYNIEPVDNTPHTFKLVTDLKELSDNQQVIFAAVANEKMYVMGATQNKNNRNAVSIKLEEGELPPKALVVDASKNYGIFKIHNNENNTYSFYDITDLGWLQGTKDASNQLKTNSLTMQNGTVYEYAKASISLENASVTFGGTNENNTLLFNPSATVFSCYKAGSNDYPTYVYVRVDAVAAPTISGNMKFSHSSEVTIEAEPGATIYYTTNNTEPTTMSPVYTGPFTITKSTNIWAIAEKVGIESKVTKRTFNKLNQFTVAPSVEPGTYYGPISVKFSAQGGTAPYGEIKYSVNGILATTDESSFTLTLSSSSTVTIISATDKAGGSMENVSFVYNIEPEDDTPQTFKLVTDLTELETNSEVIFASQSDKALYVMGKIGTTNRNAVYVKLDNTDLPKSITLDRQYSVSKIQINDKDSLSFYDSYNGGWLQGTSSAQNQLKTGSLYDKNRKLLPYATAAVSIEGNVASIVFNGENDYNNLLFNTQAAIFSCYQTGFKSGLPIHIYVKTDDVAPSSSSSSVEESSSSEEESSSSEEESSSSEEESSSSVEESSSSVEESSSSVEESSNSSGTSNSSSSKEEVNSSASEPESSSSSSKSRRDRSSSSASDNDTSSSSSSATSDKDKKTTAIAELRAVLEQTKKQDNRWIDAQGRVLNNVNGKPTAKGRYFHNGKIVIIK